MRSNSVSDTPSMLVGPDGARRPIQHRVDVFVAVGGAEAPRQGHRLADGDTVRHVLAMTELIDTDQQDRMLYGIEERRPAIRPRGQIRIERFPCAPDALDELAEVFAIRTRHVLGIAELLDQVLPGAVIELPAIERLHRELARDRALAGARAAG